MNDLDLLRCPSCASEDNRFYELGGEGFSTGDTTRCRNCECRMAFCLTRDREPAAEFADDTILSEDIIFPDEDRR